MAAIKKYNGSTWETTTARKYETATETIQSGDTIYADGTAATLSIEGNTVQNGTPTPDNPVDVQGVGVRTENLCPTQWQQGDINVLDGSEFESSSAIRSDYIKVFPNGVFSINRTIITSYIKLRFYDSSKNYVAPGGSTELSLIWGDTGTTPSNPIGDNQRFCCIQILDTNICYMRIVDTSNDLSTLYMITEGNYTPSTMPPYEPYGYKIPISNGQQTTNIYLGSTQTVRQIKKLVLDGTEPVLDTTGYFAVRIYTQCRAWTGAICNYGTGVSGDNSGNYIWFSKNIFTQSTVNDFKAFLSQQYKGNAPVIVWYVLATPQTAAVNEPLMKIGAYADTLSNATAIPTTEGANSITVDTTVQPSEFTATWTGWHDSSVKEWDGTDWN